MEALCSSGMDKVVREEKSVKWVSNAQILLRNKSGRLSPAGSITTMIQATFPFTSSGTRTHIRHHASYEAERKQTTLVIGFTAQFLPLQTLISGNGVLNIGLGKPLQHYPHPVEQQQRNRNSHKLPLSKRHHMAARRRRRAIHLWILLECLGGFCLFYCEPEVISSISLTTYRILLT